MDDSLTPMQLVPSTLVCPYIEPEKPSYRNAESNRQLIRLNSIRLSLTSRFAPLISEDLERMSLHLPSTYALTLHQQALEKMQGITEDDRVELREEFLTLAMKRLAKIRVWKKGCA